MYNKKINSEWGLEVFPLTLKPTMKELQLSKRAIAARLLKNKKVPVELTGPLVKWSGIKPKATHFKMDLGQKKIGMNEIHIIHAQDDDSLNDYSRVVTLFAIPIKQKRIHTK